MFRLDKEDVNEQDYYPSNSGSSFCEVSPVIGMETGRVCHSGIYVTAGTSDGGVVCGTAVRGTGSKNDCAKGYSTVGVTKIGDSGGTMDDPGLFCYLRAIGEASNTGGTDIDGAGKPTDMTVTDSVGGTAIAGTAGTHPLHSIDAILTHDQLQRMQPSLVGIHGGSGHGMAAMGYYCPGIESISNVAHYSTIAQFGGFGDVIRNSAQGKNIY